jgi:hypothetical protein
LSYDNFDAKCQNKHRHFEFISNENHILASKSCFFGNFVTKCQFPYIRGEEEIEYTSHRKHFVERKKKIQQTSTKNMHLCSKRTPKTVKTCAILVKECILQYLFTEPPTKNYDVNLYATEVNAI